MSAVVIVLKMRGPGGWDAGIALLLVCSGSDLVVMVYVSVAYVIHTLVRISSTHTSHMQTLGDSFNCLSCAVRTYVYIVHICRWRISYRLAHIYSLCIVVGLILVVWRRDLRHQIANRLNARWLNCRGSNKNLNSTARPYDQRAFSPLDPTAGWLSHLALAIYMVAVVNFDALARARGFRIERRQVVFLCWMQDSNPRSQTPNRQQTECPLTNRLSYRESSKNLNSTARPCDRRAHVTYKIVAMLPVRRREINLITSGGEDACLSVCLSVYVCPDDLTMKDSCHTNNILQVHCWGCLVVQVMLRARMNWWRHKITR